MSQVGDLDTLGAVNSHLRRRGEGEGHLSGPGGGGRCGSGLGVGTRLEHQAAQARTAKQCGGQHGGESNNGLRWRG